VFTKNYFPNTQHALKKKFYQKTIKVAKWFFASFPMSPIKMRSLSVRNLATNISHAWAPLKCLDLQKKYRATVPFKCCCCWYLTKKCSFRVCRHSFHHQHYKRVFPVSTLKTDSIKA
jgi:hypothetical protein